MNNQQNIENLINELFIKGIETFDNLERFISWLNKPSYGLNKQIPLNLLKTPQEIQSVLNELEKINNGQTA